MPFLDDFKLVQTSVNCLFVSAGVCERKRALRCFWSFPWEIQSLSLGPGFSVLRYESDGLCGINPLWWMRASYVFQGKEASSSSPDRSEGKVEAGVFYLS